MFSSIIGHGRVKQINCGRGRQTYWTGCTLHRTLIRAVDASAPPGMIRGFNKNMVLTEEQQLLFRERERLCFDKPRLSIATSSRLSLLLNSAPVALGDPRSRWSSAHCSPHFLLSLCGEELTRTPTQQSSDGARGEKGVRKGLHVWEVLWSPAHRGSHAVIGVSTEYCPLQTSGYTALVGGDSQSWGWELTTNQLWHEGQTLWRYPVERIEHVPKRILLVLDADAGTLGYVVEGCFLGVAFKDLPRGVELFPAVSSVRGGSTIRLRYLNGTAREPTPLMALCGLCIHLSMGKERVNQTDRLPLPPPLQCYLMPSV
ncbi:hypothetical protein DPEC_G00141360 [Dallia pectoralis]|uniref:Uncharacterized protein n=1 Tax=Dallia pectoralis TaxID=75939 RepID=A0ACC2GN73_DALPE|nr:hypothetical protein DPEC_G00141360 [Dallia pectoralis]